MYISTMKSNFLDFIVEMYHLCDDLEKFRTMQLLDASLHEPFNAVLRKAYRKPSMRRLTRTKEAASALKTIVDRLKMRGQDGPRRGKAYRKGRRLPTLKEAGCFFPTNGLQLNLYKLLGMNVGSSFRDTIVEIVIVKTLKIHILMDSDSHYAGTKRVPGKEKHASIVEHDIVLMFAKISWIWVYCVPTPQGYDLKGNKVIFIEEMFEEICGQRIFAGDRFKTTEKLRFSVVMLDSEKKWGIGVVCEICGTTSAEKWESK